MTDPNNRNFLFLQGPHGPYFHRLAKMLRAAGGQVWRVGFNAGDRAFWFGGAGYIPFQGTIEDWPDTFSSIVAEHGITDIVLYGDTRPIHADAIAAATAAGLQIHVFEEGYMRPYWVTYERAGTNGNSKLMDLTVCRRKQHWRCLTSKCRRRLPIGGTCGTTFSTVHFTTGLCCLETGTTAKW